MKRKRDESLHLLDLPPEVLAMILCLFSRPWSSVLRMVCRQFAQVLELNKLGRLDYNDDESRYTNLEYGCLGTEMPGTLGLSYIEFVRVVAPRLYEDVKRTLEMEILQKRMKELEVSCMSFDAYQELVHTPPPPGTDLDLDQKTLRRIDHAYMIYVEAARGNIEFLSWLIFRRFCFDHSVLYGLFYSNMAGTMETIYSSASVFPYMCCVLASLDDNMVCPEITLHHEMLETHFREARYPGFINERKFLIYDCLRIAANQGNLSAFKYLETIATDYPNRYRWKACCGLMWTAFQECRWVFPTKTPMEGIIWDPKEKGLFYDGAYHGHVDALLWILVRLQRYGESLVSTPAYVSQHDSQIHEFTKRICGWETGVLKGAIAAGSYENMLQLVEGGFVVRNLDRLLKECSDPTIQLVLTGHNAD
jgi:hypothetical protein